MRVSDMKQSEVGEGLYSIEAEFFTEHLVMRGELIGPDARLSDHLNGNLTNVEIRPQHVQRVSTGVYTDLSGTYASLTKAQLLFVIPLAEPDRPARSEKTSWMSLAQREAWAASGRYSIVGKVHAEAHRDIRLVLRSFQHKQFLPLTEATLIHPDGSTRECDTIILNRHRLEVFALGDLI